MYRGFKKIIIIKNLIYIAPACRMTSEALADSSAMSRFDVGTMYICTGIHKCVQSPEFMCVVDVGKCLLAAVSDAVEAATVSPRALAKQLQLGNTATLERRIRRELEDIGGFVSFPLKM